MFLEESDMKINLPKQAATNSSLFSPGTVTENYLQKSLH